MAKATIITTNSTALARAADAIMARDGRNTKNTILNDFAKSIAGPGKDWGFLKNAPQGAFTQAGIEAAKEPKDTTQTSFFIVIMDEREDWAREPSVYGSYAELIAGLAIDYRDLMRDISSDIFAAAEKVARAGGMSWPEDEDAYEAAENPGSLRIHEFTVQAPQNGSAVWALEVDHKDDWGSTRLFASKQAALAAFAQQRQVYANVPGVDINDVMTALIERGEFDSSPDDNMLNDLDSDDDEYFDRLDSAFMVTIRQITIEGVEVTTPPAKSAFEKIYDDIVLPQEQQASPTEAKDCDIVYLASYDNDQFNGNLSFGTFFKSEKEAEDYARKNGLNDDPDHHWRDELFLARDCVITAEFKAEVWQNDYSYEVDPQGETEWTVCAHELELDRADLDHLKASINAPDWVKDWSGPFEIYLSVEEPKKGDS